MTGLPLSDGNTFVRSSGKCFTSGDGKIKDLTVKAMVICLGAIENYVLVSSCLSVCLSRSMYFNIGIVWFTLRATLFNCSILMRIDTRHFCYVLPCVSFVYFNWF